MLSPTNVVVSSATKIVGQIFEMLAAYFLIVPVLSPVVIYPITVTEFSNISFINKLFVLVFEES